MCTKSIVHPKYHACLYVCRKSKFSHKGAGPLGRKKNTKFLKIEFSRYIHPVTLLNAQALRWTRRGR